MIFIKEKFPKNKCNASIWTDCIVWHVNCNNRISSYDAIYFDGFGVELIPKEIKKCFENRYIIIEICIEYKHTIR